MEDVIIKCFNGILKLLIATMYASLPFSHTLLIVRLAVLRK